MSDSKIQIAHPRFPLLVSMKKDEEHVSDAPDCLNDIAPPESEEEVFSKTQ